MIVASGFRAVQVAECLKGAGPSPPGTILRDGKPATGFTDTVLYIIHLKTLAKKERIFKHHRITVCISTGIAIAVAIAIKDSAQSEASVLKSAAQ